MKFRFVPVVAIALLLMVSCSKEISSTSSTSTSSDETPLKSSPTTRSKASTAKVASFVAAEHPTEGYARIVSENGRRFVEFDKSFKTDNGPDLFVILYRNSSVPKTGVKEQDYVQLAALEKTNGRQRYSIPEDVTLANFKSVAIWCRQFNSTYGYATLSS
jgi:Electron transfer DM13